MPNIETVEYRDLKEDNRKLRNISRILMVGFIIMVANFLFVYAQVLFVLNNR